MKRLLALTVAAALTGCANPELHELDHYAGRFKQYGYGFMPENSELDHTNKNRLSPKIMKMYTDKIVRDLSNHVDQDTLGRISVTSFVELDDRLSSTNPLGNQVAEYIVTSLIDQNYKVNDLYVNEAITLNEKGAFVFTRTNKEVLDSQYILSGTINYTPDAANIIAKIIDVDAKQVIAANVTSMPNYIVKNAFPIVEGQDLLIKGN